MAWPLDQVLYQDSFGLEAWEVLPAFGADHHPVVAGLCLEPGLAPRQAAPAVGSGDIAAADRAIRAADLMPQ
jgi:hypothetical protein